jgi:hypothetical protein
LWKRPALAYSDLPPIALNELGGAADPSHRLIKRPEMSRDLADLIVFMVNSYIRPTDIRNMQHKHIEVIKRHVRAPSTQDARWLLWAMYGFHSILSGPTAA